MELAEGRELLDHPRHPYTLGLLHSTPHVAKRARRLDPIQGLPPSLEHLPQGCAFHPRCAFRFERCFAERPPLQPVEEVREINRLMRADLWPAVEAGKISLPIDRTFPLEQAAEALAHMKANAHFGKIVLTA
jgi:oligopeptide/dipeptide ABC transporter ATP-binding protein